MFELFQKAPAQPPSAMQVFAKDIADHLVADSERMAAAGLHQRDFERLMAALPAAEREVILRVSQKLFEQDAAAANVAGRA
jgi:DNA-directed RNA polymerase specialized sigma24 family protein